MQPPSLPDFSYESLHASPVAGLDEVGRGPWAGPVVAACAIVLNQHAIPNGLHDSKKLTAKRRDSLFDSLTLMQSQGDLVTGMAFVSAADIDQTNILQASLHAMSLAFAQAQASLAQPITHALVDGNKLPALPCPATAIVKGDSISLSISIASIIAKVTRDRWMATAAEQYPHYGFERHAGYGTRQHQEALAQHGICPLHRKSFKPIAKLCA